MLNPFIDFYYAMRFTKYTAMRTAAVSTVMGWKEGFSCVTISIFPCCSYFRWFDVRILVTISIFPCCSYFHWFDNAMRDDFYFPVFPLVRSFARFHGLPDYHDSYTNLGSSFCLLTPGTRILLRDKRSRTGYDTC